MRDQNPLVAPLVEDVLNAAHDVAAAGLEMDSRIDADLQAALLHLVRAVYAHEDALELQRELELDGVREAQVFDVTAGEPPITSYPGHVERIIAAAGHVAERAAANTAATVPRYALAPVCTLMEAVTAYGAHPSAAREWQQAGHRLGLLLGEGPDDTVPPPTASPPHRRASRSGLESTAQGVATVSPGDGVAVAALPHPRAAAAEEAGAGRLLVGGSPVSRLRVR